MTTVDEARAALDWQETARQYADNADYWRKRYEKAAQELAALRDFVNLSLDIEPGGGPWREFKEQRNHLARAAVAATPTEARGIDMDPPQGFYESAEHFVQTKPATPAEDEEGWT